jgi:hypothetical protein
VPAVLLMAARMCGCTGAAAVLYAHRSSSSSTPPRSSTTTSSTSRTCAAAGGRPHEVGQHVTVLFGDFLYLKSMSLALTPGPAGHHRELCDVTLGSWKGRSTAHEERIVDTHRRGTLRDRPPQDGVSLSPARARSAACSDDASPSSATRCGSTAEHRHGVQLVDDLLDSRRNRRWQARGRRPAEGKMTLPSSTAGQGRPRADALMRKDRRAAAGSIVDWRELRTMLAQARSTDYAQRIAASSWTRAKRALYAFPAE